MALRKPWTRSQKGNRLKFRYLSLTVLALCGLFFWALTKDKGLRLNNYVPNRTKHLQPIPLPSPSEQSYNTSKSTD